LPLALLRTGLPGRVTRQWGAAYPIRYEYDDHSRMTAMRTYRNASVPLAVSPPADGGNITRWFYDAPTGLFTDKLYADNPGTSYTYTPAHKLHGTCGASWKNRKC
jgi:hypothetical protein